MAPLITHLFTADPSAHVFEGKVYIYPSHDRETDLKPSPSGDHYDMTDYHVFSTTSLAPLEPLTDHSPVLTLAQVPWASRQLWAPDAAHKNGQYYLYFPARSAADQRFRIGVAVGPTPTGPFVADPEPMPGSFSIDPAVFVDDDGEAYMYFGGLWGGELQCYPRGDISIEDADAGHPGCFDHSQISEHGPNGSDVAALSPRVAKLTPDMRSFASPAREAHILAPETGQPVVASDHARRFFEAAWMHKRNGEYYFSYSTGDTHLLCYARGKSPWGPFVYGGVILEPVYGWTTHHSVVEFGGRWWLFYHDAEMSGGVNHLRCVKVRELEYDEEGGIVKMTPEKIV